MQTSAIKRKLKFFATTLGISLLLSFTQAMGFNVDTGGDAGDENPGDGICKIALSNRCTLRAAVMEANVSGGPQEIVLQAGATYTLTRANEGGDAEGDLDITNPAGVTVVGSYNPVSGLWTTIRRTNTQHRLLMSLQAHNLLFAV